MNPLLRIQEHDGCVVHCDDLSAGKAFDLVLAKAAGSGPLVGRVDEERRADG